MNKCIFTGRITKDPEIRYNPSNVASIRFMLAVDRQVKDAAGQRQADFINMVAFGTTADFISKYVRKGNMLAIESRVQTGSYQNQQGATIYTTDFVVERVENLSPREPQAQQQQNVANIPQQPQSFNVPNNVASDDLPF